MRISTKPKNLKKGILESLTLLMYYNEDDTIVYDTENYKYYET